MAGCDGGEMPETGTLDCPSRSHKAGNSATCGRAGNHSAAPVKYLVSICWWISCMFVLKDWTTEPSGSARQQSDPGVSERPGAGRGRHTAGDVPPAATVRPAAEGPGAAAAPDLTESEPKPSLQPRRPLELRQPRKSHARAEPAAAEPRLARPDRKKPWSTEKSSVGSGAVLEPPTLTEAGAEVQGNRMETPDTTPVQGERGRHGTWRMSPFSKYRIKGKNKYTLNVTRDIVRSLKALEIEIVELQRLEATGDRGHIEALKKSGDLLSESTEIRKQTVSFYSKLYSSEWSGAQVVEDSFLVGLPKLSERAARELDRELSLEELHEALQRMENGRASGGAVLTLLPKKGDLTHLKNWRPVSLLCTDYKLLSKALASRLTKVMERLIPRQTYCVPDRSIFDNVYLIRDILDVSRLLGLKTGLIFLDQEKAFDRVEHEYLWKVLETFGFNPGFVAMIRVLYCEN
ncbi:hypothetical protein QTP70_002399 [Hemibagrus guttatus]|uniref:Reverse transcriptase domain-containing protein n=1 Tax=Hemibagrus guttatus TaxID=175788 RepID=A0AAE0RD19_9TELE|nr:hypothetical protein QTP70_002399 [Hemibagrus guttatus]